MCYGTYHGGNTGPPALGNSNLAALEGGVATVCGLLEVTFSAIHGRQAVLTVPGPTPVRGTWDVRVSSALHIDKRTPPGLVPGGAFH